MKKREVESWRKILLKIAYLSGTEADEFECDVVWPRETEELVPPSGDHLRHVEAGQEADWDEVGELSRIHADHLKHLSEKERQEIYSVLKKSPNM